MKKPEKCLKKYALRNEKNTLEAGLQGTFFVPVKKIEKTEKNSKKTLAIHNITVYNKEKMERIGTENTQNGTIWKGVETVSYLGVFFHNIDNNSRLVIPSSFRESIGQEFVLFKSPDGCVSVYDKETFEGLLSQVRQFTNTPEGRKKARTFTRAARNTTQDKQGRFTVPQDFIEFAALENGVVITGEGNHLEIWSKSEFDSQQADDAFTAENYPEIYY